MCLQSKTGKITEMTLTKNILTECLQAEPMKKCKFDFTRISWRQQVICAGCHESHFSITCWDLEILLIPGISNLLNRLT